MALLHRNPTPLRRGKDLNPLSVGLGQLELGSTVTTNPSSSVLALKLNRAKEGFPKDLETQKQNNFKQSFKITVITTSQYEYLYHKLQIIKQIA